MSTTHAKQDHSGRFFRYTLLPEFLPRSLNLFTSGFGILAYCIANIFNAVKILPANHAYLQPQNFQKYGIVSVLAETSRLITWDRKHIDQIAVYFIILAAFLTLITQFVILGSSIFMGSAFANPTDIRFPTPTFNFIFIPTFPEQDYALRVLDLVFGLQNLAGTSGYFESCVGSAAVCNDFEGNPLPPYPTFPLPMHAGFHSMIHFYNYGIIALSFVILLYYLVTMAAETTIHGTFWGQRGNKTWIPVRVIFFLALIMPFYQGFNLAQIITLNAAYFGTGVASNAWREVNNVVADNLTGQHDTLMGSPDRSNYPNSVGMVRFMTIVKTCKYAEQFINGREIQAYVVKHAAGATTFDNCRPLGGVTPTSYANALDFSNNENIRIRFGQRVQHTPASGGAPGTSVACTDTNPASYAGMSENYSSQPGYVIPYCGELILTAAGPETISYDIREGVYEEIITNLWDDNTIDTMGREFAESALGRGDFYRPDFDPIRDLIRARDTQLETIIQTAVTNTTSSTFFDIEAPLGECGWMCAALYYNRIAEANGLIQAASFSVPDIRLWPSSTEEVIAARSNNNSAMDVCDMLNPMLPGTQSIDFSEESNREVANIISTSYEYFCRNDLLNTGIVDGFDDSFRFSMAQSSGNPAVASIVAMFGLNGLYDMRENTDIHPLAQLSILGKGMVESTIQAFGVSAAGSVAGFRPIQRLLGEGITSMSQPISAAATSFGMIGLAVGFTLFYVLPYLPFIYFFFAAANWVKAIFEAMIGLPLWALAHLRLDGEGIIGDAASAGYWLILEIFLRPFLILVGLLASISVFMAMVKVLNDMFDLVVANVGGFNARNGVALATGGTPSVPDPFNLDNYRNPIDQFFYTVIYAVIVYMMALASFKMIDYIPNEILRWTGASARTFGDFQQDHAGQLMGIIGQGVTLGAVLGGGSLERALGGNSGVGRAASSADSDPRT